MFGSTSEEHDLRLTNVLKKFSRFGITLNLQKCVYKVQKLERLGAVISKDGVQMSEKNIEAITKLKIPTNVSELRSVLGLFQHYSKYSETCFKDHLSNKTTCLLRPPFL